jgi:hypothetical protein
VFEAGKCAWLPPSESGAAEFSPEGGRTLEIEGVHVDPEFCSLLKESRRI